MQKLYLFIPFYAFCFGCHNLPLSILYIYQQNIFLYSYFNTFFRLKLPDQHTTILQCQSMLNWIQYLHLQVCCIFSLLSYKNQHPSFSLRNSPQQSCKTSLMLVNPLNCCLFGKVFISSSFMKNNLPEKSILGWQAFFSHKFEYIILSVLDSQVSTKKSTDIFKEIYFS